MSYSHLPSDKVVQPRRNACQTARGHKPTARFTRRHGYKILHAVSTMNVHPLTDRAQPVSGIRISGMLLAIQLYPVIMIAAFRFVGKVMPAEVMDIRSFGMGYLSQCPLPHHVQGRQGKSIITTVLQHHAVPACLLGGIHQTPAVRHAHGGRHLKSGMASLLHGIYRNIGMCQPIGTNINQVNIRTSAQLPPSAVFAIGNSRRAVETVEQCSGTLYIPGRKSHKAFTSTPSRCIYRSRAKSPITQPHKANAEDRYRRTCQMKYVPVHHDEIFACFFMPQR